MKEQRLKIGKGFGKRLRKLRKAACGSDRAQKAEMILVARERFAKAVTSDDEADALNLLWLAMSENKETP
jgi:Holliday junction resolvasome RuvABC endonuclease subunit